MQIWPAIDIQGGRSVRTAQFGVHHDMEYSDSPIEIARRWIQMGAERLHLVDVDGAIRNTRVNQKLICEIIREVDVPCQVAGGIRDLESVEFFLDAGAERVVCGTKAVTDLSWLETASSKNPFRIVVGIDACNDMAVVKGRKKILGEKAIALAIEAAKFPIAAIVYADLNRVGFLNGPNLDALQNVLDAVKQPVIAAGGVACLDDLAELSRRQLSGCIVATAFYEGCISIEHANAAAARLTVEGRLIV